MDKKLLENKYLQIDNSALEEAMELAAAEHSQESTRKLFAALQNAELLVPVIPPKNFNPQFLKNNKGGVKMMPVIMKNKDGDQFAPAFTSVEMIKQPERFPLILRFPMKEVCKTAQNFKPELKGIWLNSETKGIIIHQDFVKALLGQNTPAQQGAVQGQSGEAGKKQIRMTPQQYAVFARKTVEHAILPADIHAKKGAFMEELEEKREQLLLEYYRKPFGDKIPCNYTEDDFSVMVLDIDDDTTAAIIELPTKNIAITSALNMYIVWFPKLDEIHYYLIEKGEPQQSNVLTSVNGNKERSELMSAPAVGSELTTVLELIQEEREENAAQSGTLS